MKKILYILLFLIVFTFLQADFSGLNSGTRSLGMGNAFSAMAEEEESLFYNPAGTSGLDYYGLSTSYENSYGISDLLNLNITAMMPYREFVYGLAIQQANLLDVYSENIMYLNVAWKYDHKKTSLMMGTNFKYFFNSGEGEVTGLKKPADLDFGLILRHRGISLSYSNINLMRNNDEIDHIKNSHLLGMAFKWQNLLNFAVDYELCGEESFFRTGIELWFFDTFAPRMGFDDEYLTMGFGLKTSWWKFNFGMKAHEELGTTYRFGLSLKKEK